MSLRRRMHSAVDELDGVVLRKQRQRVCVLSLFLNTVVICLPCDDQTLPASICNLVRIQTLGLGHNRLQDLPDEMGKLVTLQVLRVSNNQLTKLPPSVVELTDLRLLDASHNRIARIPDAIRMMSTLEALYLQVRQTTLGGALCSA